MSPLLLLLLACRSSTREDTADTASPGDSPADTAGDSGPDDTAGDSGPDDTGEELPADALHRWPAPFDAPDLRILPCGGRADGPVAVAPGPDLDGDGLAELAVGVAGHDADGEDAGIVRLYRSGDLAGALDGDAAHAWAEGDAASDGLGARLQWVGDRDGDGVDDLLATGADQPMRLLSGAALAAGGPRGVSVTIDEAGGRAVRWDDLDGDGVDDWLFGLPDRGLTGVGSDRGGIMAVLDAAFDADGTLDFDEAVYDADGYGRAGTALALLATDHDRDGIREPVTNLGDDLVVVNSGTMLDWATWVDDGVRWRFPGRAGADLLSLGDVDGGGREDVLLREDDELCVAFGENADPTDMAVTCTALATRAAVVGDDLGGDGVPEVWLAMEGGIFAVDGAALAAGTFEGVALVEADGTVARLELAEGQLWVGMDVPEAWLPATAAFVAAPTGNLGPTATIAGGGEGGDPTAPTWRDLDGDGAAELLFYADTLAVFRGANLGVGERELCDADAVVPLGATALAWVDDATGDGVDDAVAIGLPAAGQGSVLDGAGLLAGEAVIVTTWTSEDGALPVDGCDVDGDGRDELLAWTGGVGTRVWSGTVVDGAAPALLGVLDAVAESCLPDLDGDGGAEVLGQGWYVYASGALAPATELGWRDAWAALPIDGAPAWRALLSAEDADGDGVATLAWWRTDGGAAQIGALEASDLGAGVDAAGLPFTTWASGGAGYADAWVDAVLTSAPTDPVWVTLDADGAPLAVQSTDGRFVYDLAIVPTRAEGDVTTWALGPAPDLAGVGARALALVWGGLDGGRPELAVVYAE